MIKMIFMIATSWHPNAATAAILVLSFCAIAVIISVRVQFASKTEPLKQYDVDLTPNQRNDATIANKKKFMQQCFDTTVKLLKRAVIKKTYNNSVLISSSTKTIYTIPLNRLEAVKYVWAQVIRSSSKDESARVIRMAAHILGVFDENKDKHILELEAQAIAAAKIYGGISGAKKLQIRAVDNVDVVKDSAYQHMPLVMLAMREKLLVAQETVFTWPQKVDDSIKSLRRLALLAVSQDDVESVIMFPCICCQTICTVTDLKNLKCPQCREKYEH